MSLNSRQKTSLVIFMAIELTCVGAHNPFGGYANTETSRGSPSYDWQPDRKGCTKELEAKLYQMEFAGSPDHESLADSAERMRRRGEIYQQCMKYIPPPIYVEKKPIFSWVSLEPIVPGLADVKSLVYAMTFVALWGVVANFVFRSA